MNDPAHPDSSFGASSANDPFLSGNDPFQAAKASAMKAAEELRTAAAQKASELRGAAENRAQQFKSVAEQKASDLKSEFSEKAGEFKSYAEEAVGQARESLGQAKERCETFVADAEKLVQVKPRQALLTAFGVGLVVGLLLRR